MKKTDKKAQGPEALKKKTYQGLIIAENFYFGKNLSLIPCPLESTLEKAIQLLEKSKVEEIFIFASSSKAEVMKYLTGRGQKKVPIKFIYSPDCVSFGDCLRSVHALKVITQPFILVSADVLTEVSLQPIIELYEERLEKLKPLLMLKLFFEKETSLPTELYPESLIVYDKNKMVLKQYQKLASNIKNMMVIKENAKFNFKGIFESPNPAESLVINTKLMDAGIAVCSIEMLAYFSENFDFHSERDDFLKDLLSSEINDDHVSLHILSHEIFHKRVINPFELYRSSSLIIKNCYNKFYINKDEYLFSRFNRIISKKSKIGVNTQIGNHVFIGDNVQIEENCFIENSIILPNTTIGKNTKVRDSFIGVASIVDSNQYLANVYIAFSTKVEFITKKYENLIHDGNSWRPINFNTNENPAEDTEELHFEFNEHNPDVKTDFREEVREVIQRLSENFSQSESAITELMNIRLAENKTHLEMVDAIFQEILLCNEVHASNPLDGIKKLANYGPVLKKFVLGDEERRLIIHLCEGYSDNSPSVKFHLLIQLQYQIGILTDEVIISWFEEKKSSHNEKDQQKVGLMEKFIEWLQNAESEEEEEADEEDDENGESD